MVNTEKYKVKAIYNTKEDIHMGLGGKGDSGGTGGGEAGQDGKGLSSGYILLIVLFIILIVVGVSYSGLGL
ncbi:sporulation protein YjcZ [Bacillus cereus]|uniref:Sporulation protein YjcZ n=2 Tax=Bacillus cereus TaxID=1396 RepID=A0A2B3TX55_BACCE|nr:sporulation protein YjcZ [Bacillus cereus]